MGGASCLLYMTSVCKIKHLKILTQSCPDNKLMALKIIQCWSNNTVTFNHISYTYYGMQGYTYLTQLCLIKQHTWVMFLEPLSLQDKISGICHLSCSYQAKEADSVKEKTYCSFCFIWPVKRVCKTPRVLMFQEWVSMTDIKSIFYWSHQHVYHPNLEMKEIPVSPSLSKTEIHWETYLWDVTRAAHGMPQSLLILKEQE